MKKILIIIISSVLTLLSIVSGYFLDLRKSFDYNSEGKYFDPETMVVYNEQSLIFFYLIFVLFSICAILGRVFIILPLRNNHV
jgi:hypothetical protein